MDPTFNPDPSDLFYPVVSPSLMKKPEWSDPLSRFKFNPAFSLGPEYDEYIKECLDWIPDESVLLDDYDEAPVTSVSSAAPESPPPKRSKLSLNRRSKPGCSSAASAVTAVTKPLKEITNTRFATPVTSPERAKAAKGVIPTNTEASTRWAMKNFNAWALNRSASGNQDDFVPPDLLKTHDAALVCKWLCRYVMETRREDGTPYPPSTLRSLLSGVNRTLQSNNAPFSILDKHNPQFRDLIKTLDTVSSGLHKDGVGATKHSAPIIDPKHENLFWETGLLGSSSPKVLQYTVFFYVGMNFVLRGIQEQHDLAPSQLVRVPEDVTVYDESVYYQYTEFISKNNQHRFKDTNSTNKSVRAYAQPGSNRCIVKLLDTYMALLPPGSPVFYLRALNEFPSEPNKSCFVNQRVGINWLRNILPELSQKSGCGVRYTNHSLRATAITRMFNSGVPEKIIAENSGHKSTKALRCYERTSSELQKGVSKVLAKPGNSFEGCKSENSPAPVPKVELETPANEKECKPTLPAPSAANPFAHTLSGTFSNCTINISMK